MTRSTKTPKPRTTKVTWIATANLKPPVDDHAFYATRYSVPVLLKYPRSAVFRWDFRRRGWVGADWAEGPDPEHYADWGIEGDRWHPLPALPSAKRKTG